MDSRRAHYVSPIPYPGGPFVSELSNDGTTLLNSTSVERRVVEQGPGKWDRAGWSRKCLRCGNDDYDGIGYVRRSANVHLSGYQAPSWRSLIFPTPTHRLPFTTPIFWEPVFREAVEMSAQRLQWIQCPAMFLLAAPPQIRIRLLGRIRSRARELFA